MLCTEHRLEWLFSARSADRLRDGRKLNSGDEVNASNDGQKRATAAMATATTTTTTAFQVPHFDETTDKWDTYWIRVEAYFEGNEITEDKRKRALLVAALGSRTIDVLKGLCAPRKINELAYKEVVDILNQHYAPRPNEIA